MTAVRRSCALSPCRFAAVGLQARALEALLFDGFGDSGHGKGFEPRADGRVPSSSVAGGFIGVAALHPPPVPVTATQRGL